MQGRITEALYGNTLADEETLLSARALQKSIGEMPENSPRLTPEPRDVGADDSLSDVAYDKGSWFLRFLEQRFGRATFDAYLQRYFDHFAFQSITTGQMLAYLKPNLFDKTPGVPLYKAFVETPAGLAYAQKVYVKAKPGYHPMTQAAVERIFAKAKKTPATVNPAARKAESETKKSSG